MFHIIIRKKTYLLPVVCNQSYHALSLLQAKKEKMGGNMAGDGMQNGGLLIVEKGSTSRLLCSLKFHWNIILY